MQTIETQLRRSYFYRMAFMAALTGGLSLWLASFGMRYQMWPLVLFSILPLGVWAVIVVAEYRRGAKTLDAEGVTRRDGKRFLWADLQDIRFVYWRLQSGQQGALNHCKLRFSRGQARIFPLILENGWDVIAWVERLDAQRKSPAPTEAPPAPKKDKPFKPCSICSQLSDFQYGFQKHGREEEDTFLPKAMASLKFVREVKPGKNRSPELLQCPECGTYYLYEVEYEYLATGSEDEQRLTRLTDEEAAQYLA